MFRTKRVNKYGPKKEKRSKKKCWAIIKSKEGIQSLKIFEKVNKSRSVTQERNPKLLL